MYFKWGHFVMGIMILLFFILKRLKRNNLAQFLLYTSFPVSYLLPILKAVYRYNKDDKFHEKGLIEPMKIWIQIELFYFFFFIVSIIVFMIYAYFKKYKSLTKSTSDILVEETQKD